MKKAITGVLAAAAIGSFAAVALSEKVKIVRYEVETAKISGKIRAAVVSDLHSSKFGKHSQSELIDPLLKLKPDVILLSGDIVDERKSPAPAFTLLKQINRIAPCFYVTGNHEYYDGHEEDIKNRIRELDIDVLEGDVLYFTKGDDIIQIAGMNDRYANKERFFREIKSVKEGLDKDFFGILISHRPDLVDHYEDIGADITVSGHAHGGQFIIPGVINGLYAPQQGVFPKYAGGRYKLCGTDMIVSRGLMKDVKPRLFNPPELVVIDIVGKGID